MNLPPSGSQPQRVIDGRRLWSGGAATAVVAALVAVVGVLIGEGALELDMVEPPLLPVGESFAVRYAVTAAALALLATGLAHLLALTTPRPRSFFSWIVGLATACAVVLPLTLDGAISGKLATAVVNLVIGACVISLLASVLARTVGFTRGNVRPGPDDF
jgi:hypothetical protein